MALKRPETADSIVWSVSLSKTVFIITHEMELAAVVYSSTTRMGGGKGEIV
jgi:ABC-type polar amino acid transport system ATPase subunit